MGSMLLDRRVTDDLGAQTDRMLRGHRGASDARNSLDSAHHSGSDEECKFGGNLGRSLVLPASDG
jgi:hypothetical protein